MTHTPSASTAKTHVFARPREHVEAAAALGGPQRRGPPLPPPGGQPWNRVPQPVVAVVAQYVTACALEGFRAETVRASPNTSGGSIRLGRLYQCSKLTRLATAVCPACACGYPSLRCEVFFMHSGRRPPSR